jgi:hypothetical protein
MAIWTDVMPWGYRSRRRLLSWIHDTTAGARGFPLPARRHEAVPRDTAAMHDGAVGEEPAPFWDAPRHWRL